MTGTSILSNVTSGVRLALEVAWGADLTDLTGAGWTWTDITADVQLSQGWGISLQLGATDEATQTQASTLTAVLDNTAGGYSLGPQSANYPNVVRNVPVRLRVSTNFGSAWTVHYQGNAVGFTPNWDTSGQWATVTLTASGWLRQLNQGTPFPQSSMYLGTIADSTVQAYWPLEEGQNSTVAGAAIGGADGVFRAYHPGSNTWTNGANPGSFASYSNVASSAPMLTMGSGGGLILTAASTIGTTATCTSMIIGNPTSQSGANGCLFSVYTPNGAAIKRWDVFYGCDTSSGADFAGALSLYGVSTASAGIPYGATVVAVANITFDLIQNTDYEIGLSLSQSGATTTYNLRVYQLGSSPSTSHYSSTVGGNSNGAQVNQVIIGTFAAGNVPFGHVIIRNAIPTNGSDDAWINAHAAEAGTTRLTRLADASNIPITINTDSATETSTNPVDTVGFQFYDSLSNLLREVETTCLGALYDGLGIGLTYVTRLLRESQQPLLTLDASSGVLVMPFAPVYDDQHVINQAAVSQRTGATVTYDDTASQAAIGVFSTSTTINQSQPTISDLDNYARWQVRGSVLTEGDYRYPSWTFDLTKDPSLIADWLACFPACRVDVTNIDTARSQHPAGTIRNVLQGWHETISQHRWVVQANTSSYEPWKIITLAAATGSTEDTVGRYEPDSDTASTVNTSAAVGATSLSVAFTGTRWVTTADTGGSDNFPLTVDINGYPVTVSNITGTTSPQTFTVSALTHAVTAGDPITIYQNAVLGM
jgi:hypothetical protein